MKVFLLFLIIFAAANITRAQEPTPRIGKERVVFHTTMGDLVLAFYPDVAPQHTEQILKLVRMGVYDNIDFYRVDKSFVIQISDAKGKPSNPLTPEQRGAIHPLTAEFSSLKHKRGTLSMAHADNQPDSGETSFSFLLINAPHLDQKYTIFGFLEKGEDILTAISNVPVDAQKRPLQPILVTKAEVVDSPEALQQMNLRLQPIEQIAQSPHLLGVDIAVWIAGAVIVYGLALFLFASRLTPKILGAIGLLTSLIGFFSLFVASVSLTKKSQVIGLIVFLATLGLFKLMNRFENNRT